ncbi:MAG: hypothetical protein H6744_12045 [Deltaproteobacteria bacterium]|nr:hypothetical protein [Deltaproteobacteria bacterium]MCB9787402.1 hypothetical protein [Deltaproteobacteria bacterium]
MTHEGTLAALIEQLGHGRERFDEDFARDLARELHAHADRLELPVIEGLGLVDVLVSFSMDREMRLMVTGYLPAHPGSVTVRWDEREFPEVPVALLENPREEPYLFATLDFSVRGRAARLKAAAGPWAEGTRVTLRALATVGDRTEYRVEAGGRNASLSPEQLELE